MPLVRYVSRSRVIVDTDLSPDGEEKRRERGSRGRKEEKRGKEKREGREEKRRKVTRRKEKGREGREERKEGIKNRAQERNIKIRKLEKERREKIAEGKEK